jgi:aryl-alcohol dehydrogenase-like predicted oxidoreductase
VHQGRFDTSGPRRSPPRKSSRRSGSQRSAVASGSCEQPPYALLIRGVEAEVLPTCERYGIGVICWGPLAGGWLSGRWRKGADHLESTRARRAPLRYDLSIPANQAKLDATEAFAQLAEESGLTLIHLALAFVLRHRSVTSAIIGPRTMEHLESQLASADVELSDDVLDNIDRIVAPGQNVTLRDIGWIPPEIAFAKLRRR